MQKIISGLLFLTLISCNKGEVSNKSKSTMSVSTEVVEGTCKTKCSEIHEQICDNLIKEYDICKNSNGNTQCNGFVSDFSEALKKTVVCTNTCSGKAFYNLLVRRCDSLDPKGYPKITERSSHLLSKLKFKKAKELFFSAHFSSILDGALAEDIRPKLQKAQADESSLYNKVKNLIFNEKVEELKKLKNNGVKFNEIIYEDNIKLGINDNSLVQNAISTGNIEILKMILSERKIDSSKWSSCSLSYAFDAVEEEGTKNMISYLISQGEDINCNKSNSGYGGPLAKAIQVESVDLVKFLISNGVKVDQNYSAVGSPVIVAIKEKKKKIAMEIISHSKDFSFTDDDGKTALDIAKELKMDEVVQVLSKKK